MKRSPTAGAGLATVLAGLLAALACRTPLDPSAPEGLVIYRTETCANCHDEDGSGSWAGPPLRDLERHWDVDGLVRFLADPESFRARDERLDALSRDALSQMTPFAHLSEGQRRTVARYLLSGTAFQ